MSTLAPEIAQNVELIIIAVAQPLTGQEAFTEQSEIEIHSGISVGSCHLDDFLKFLSRYK